MVADLSRSAIGTTSRTRFTYRKAGRLSTLAASIFKATIRTTWNGREKRSSAGCAGEQKGIKNKPSPDDAGGGFLQYFTQEFQWTLSSGNSSMSFWSSVPSFAYLRLSHSRMLCFLISISSLNPIIYAMQMR